MTWLYIPSNCAPASGCSAKDCEPGSNTWADRLASSATLNGKLTLPASWRRASKKDRWIRHLSGPTFSPSTVDASVDAWISSLRASRARTSVSRASALGFMVLAAASSSGSSTSQTIATRQDSFWRTSQASLLPPPPLWTKPKASSSNERPPASWENWPTAGGMRNGSLSPRPMWAPAMGATAGSASHGGNWPTPTTEIDQGQTSEAGRNTPSLSVAALVTEKWTTPSATDGERGGTLTEGMTGSSLTQQVNSSAWPTPTSTAGGANSNRTARGKVGANIKEAAQLWQTPSAENFRTRGGDRSDEMGLDNQAKNWPTPTAGDANGSGSRNTANSKAHPGLSLNDAVRGDGGQGRWPTPTAQDSEQAGGAGTIERGKRGHSLNSLVSVPETDRWPTPRATTRAGDSGSAQRQEQGPNPGLYDMATKWPTPANRDYRSPNAESYEERGGGSKGEQLQNYVAHHFSPLDQPIPPGPELSPPLRTSRLRLNPIFGEWLMGWRLGWTIAEPHASSASATVLWRCKLQSHLSSLLAEPASAERLAA